jgi:UPF0755 protein
VQTEVKTSENKRRWYDDKRIRAALFAALILFLSVGSVAGYFLSYAFYPGPAVPVNRVSVYIPRGTSVQNISEILAEARLIQRDPRFVHLARLSGLSGRLQAGEFNLLTNQKPLDVMRELATARPLEHVVTIPEGLNIEEIADILAEDGWIKRDRFIALSHDRTFLDELGLTDSSSVEGYLFPDTYNLIRPSLGERMLISKLVDRSMKVWEGLERIDTVLSRHEVFTLASIIEKETAQSAERTVIAAVFLNRLKRKMRLQSDPTVIYGMTEYNGKLVRSDLKRPTPYNTYLIPGLPPGPICSPGKDSLQSVLLPDHNNFLYFVSKNDGTHYFSKNLKEHNRAVRKYQRNKTSQRKN